MDISQARLSLDPLNDDPWTSDGLPRVEVIQAMTGDKTLKRGDITNDDPKFTRDAHLRAKAAENSKAPLPGLEELEATGQATGHEGARDEAKPLEELGPEAADEPAIEEDSELSLMGMDELLAVDGAVFKDYAALTAFINRSNQVVTEADVEVERLQKRSRSLARKTDLAVRVRDKIEKNMKTPNGIQDYLRIQKKAREERAARAQRFIEAGTSAQDVRAQLDGRSRIDAALNQRKAAPGSTRPAHGLPVRGQRGA